MSNLFEGEGFIGRVRDAQVGKYNGKIRVSANFEIVDGPYKGRRIQYDGKTDPENLFYTKRDMVAMGWKGKSQSTFAKDVEDAGLTLEFSVRIASFNGRQWLSVGRIGAALQLQPLDRDEASELDRYFSEVPDQQPGRGGDEPPHAADSGMPF
jgi:hypothetical protein